MGKILVEEGRVEEAIDLLSSHSKLLLSKREVHCNDKVKDALLFTHLKENLSILKSLRQLSLKPTLPVRKIANDSSILQEELARFREPNVREALNKMVNHEIPKIFFEDLVGLRDEKKIIREACLNPVTNGSIFGVGKSHVRAILLAGSPGKGFFTIHLLWLEGCVILTYMVRSVMHLQYPISFRGG